MHNLAPKTQVCIYDHCTNVTGGFPGGSVVKNLPANAGDMGSIPKWRSSGVGNANHSSIFAWKTAWTEKPGGLQSMVSQRIGHDLVTKQQCDTCYNALATSSIWWQGVAQFQTKLMYVPNSFLYKIRFPYRTSQFLMQRLLASTSYSASDTKVFLNPNEYVAQINQSPPYKIETVFNLLENQQRKYAISNNPIWYAFGRNLHRAGTWWCTKRWFICEAGWCHKPEEAKKRSLWAVAFAAE